MSINLVQFQPGLSVVEFLQQYGTEAKCYRALYRTRWPKGFRCPACGDRRRSRFARGRQVYYQCRACRHQTTLHVRRYGHPDVGAASSYTGCRGFHRRFVLFPPLGRC